MVGVGGVHDRQSDRHCQLTTSGMGLALLNGHELRLERCTIQPARTNLESCSWHCRPDGYDVRMVFLGHCWLRQCILAPCVCLSVLRSTSPLSVCMAKLLKIGRPVSMEMLSKPMPTACLMQGPALHLQVPVETVLAGSAVCLRDVKQ